LLNTPSSLLLGLCLSDSDLSRLILENILVRSGLPDMLQERPDLRLLPPTFSVLDSECCDTSWTFEFLPEHPSKLRRVFTSFSFSCLLRRAASDTGPFGFFKVFSFPFPTMFRTADVGEEGIRAASDTGPFGFFKVFSFPFPTMFRTADVGEEGIRSPSPYNGNIGRPGIKKIQAIPSTTHEMLKFSVPGGVLTLRSSRIIPLECMMVSGPEAQPSDIIRPAEEKIKVSIHPEYP
nr:reverse transcriptase domain-containing protein [Tanacetum cinerariifolium]